MSTELNREVACEQAFVDRAYATLDRLREGYRSSQRKVEAEGAWGSPQARTERDAMAAHFGDQAARLEQIEDRLVFGRIDVAAKTTGEVASKSASKAAGDVRVTNSPGADASTDIDTNANAPAAEVLHIGRVGLRGEDESRLLIDWRAPAARPFYQATAANPQEVARRRHIATHLRQVTGIEDEVLDAQAANDQGLTFQGEGALMSALTAARQGQMSDIISTIQAEQDAVIRADTEGILVVQGGPGTGKTAVALHRAAYLLYAKRQQLERSGVLVVGPSRGFLDYIGKVLPSLGETSVVSLTIADLVPEIQVTDTDTPEVAAAKGSLSWLPTLKKAVRDLQRIPREDKVFRLDDKHVVLTVEDFLEARSHARLSWKPHNEARDDFARELMNKLMLQLDETDDAATRAWWYEEIRASREIRREINLCWMPTSATGLLEKLFAQPERLQRVALGLTQREMELVYRPKGSGFTAADVPLLDELEELLGTNPVLKTAKQRAQQEDLEAEREHIQKSAREVLVSQELGDGIVTAEMLAERTLVTPQIRPLAERAKADRTWTYGHVVVDEAQELSHMAWHCLLRRCPSWSFTVVGDLDQARGNAEQRPGSWAELLGPARKALRAEMTLSVSYRTPAEIMDLAQGILADLGQPVQFPLVCARQVEDALADTVAAHEKLLEACQRAVKEELARLDEQNGEGVGKIAVLMSEARAEGWDYGGENTYSIEARLNYLSVVAAKGLEFDTVVLVEPEEILAESPGDLFVAMTRCTKRLHTVRSGALPERWLRALKV